MSTSVDSGGMDEYGRALAIPDFKLLVRAAASQQISEVSSSAFAIGAALVMVSGDALASRPFLLLLALAVIAVNMWYRGAEVERVIANYRYHEQVSVFYGLAILAMAGSVTSVSMNGHIWTGVFWLVGVVIPLVISGEGLKEAARTVVLEPPS